jgi:HPt (histidine-containing phosphotransfer) domain-containing protein
VASGKPRGKRPGFRWGSSAATPRRKPELAARAIDRFVEETPRRLEQLKRRIGECDGCGTQAHARALASAAATVSAESLCSLAAAIEEAELRCEFKCAAGQLPQAEEQFRRFTLAVRQNTAC